MTRVLLTGASGFLGGHILGLLRSENVQVAALCRSAQAAERARALGAQPVSGELSDTVALSAALAEPTDAIFHTAADTSQWRLGNAAQTRTNVEGTRRLLFAARAAGVRRFVHTSSVAAYGRVEHTALFEALPRLGVESWINYERSKALGESLVREAGLRGDIETVILNPAHIFGPGDRHNWARLILMIDQKKLPGAPPGSGAFADVREVAKAHVSAWRTGRSGDNWLLGGEHASFLHLIQRIAAELGRPAPRRAMPATLLRMYAAILDIVGRISGREPSLTPEAVALTSQRLRVDSRKAEAELAYRTTPLDTLIRDTVNWLRNESMLLPR
ncbi:MAG: NAD-dependent epimerase/dehydratase family protein [Tahibacter sp.]